MTYSTAHSALSQGVKQWQGVEWTLCVDPGSVLVGEESFKTVESCGRTGSSSKWDWLEQELVSQLTVCKFDVVSGLANFACHSSCESNTYSALGKCGSDKMKNESENKGTIGLCTVLDGELPIYDSY